MEIVIALGLIAICGAAIAGPKFNIAAPLLLVALGIGVGFFPGVPPIHIEPELILEGLLPPLLYSAAVSMPVMDFRREFGAISGLSMLLVVFATATVGVLLWWLIPGLDLPWAIALGAVLSPTDAVATTIVKATGVSPRIISILEGEGLLNDASALVMLRTAIAAAAVSVSAWEIIGSLVWSVTGAVVVGFLVGKGNLLVRSRISTTVATTALSFAVPFIAMAGAEALGASGLVGAVVAGLITGQGAAKYLSPSQRLSDSQNWETIEFILEGIIFLSMGLQFHTLIVDLADDSLTVILQAVGVALIALLASVMIRALFVMPLLAWLESRARRREAMRPRLEAIQTRLEGGDLNALPRSGGPIEMRANDPNEGITRRNDERYKRTIQRNKERMERRRRREMDRQAAGRRPSRRLDMDQLLSRMRRAIADIDYFLASPLSWRDGAVVVWAGMRGAITVAAAQTLPLETPQRSYLILIAFLVAGLSLLIQGGTLKAFVALIKPTPAPSKEAQDEERREILQLMIDAKEDLLARGEASELDVIEAQRTALLKARDERLFDSAILAGALAVLDADHISVQMKSNAKGHAQE